MLLLRTISRTRQDATYAPDWLNWSRSVASLAVDVSELLLDAIGIIDASLRHGCLDRMAIAERRKTSRGPLIVLPNSELTL